MKNIISALLVIFSLSVFGQKTRCQKITVEPYMSFQFYEHFNRLVLNASDPNVEFISGFDFKWSYKYKLKVKVEEFEEALSDGSRFNYSLVKGIKKEKVTDPYEFKLFLTSKPYPFETDETVSNFKYVNDSTYQYFDKIDIEVPSELKSEFEKIRSGEMSKNGNLRFVGENKAILLRFD